MSDDQVVTPAVSGGFGPGIEDAVQAGEEDREASYRVVRCLVIAVGGTGRRIVADIRRRLVDCFGNINEVLPIVQFAYIDTNTNDFEQPEAEPGQPVWVNIPPANKIRAFVTGMKNIREDLPNYPHLEKTVPDQALHGDITQGAGSVRARGRLALVWNAPAIVERLQELWGAITEPLPAEERPFTVANLPPRVHIVGSLRGGTGGGMAADLAYLVRSCLTPEPDRIIGTYLLPSIQEQYLSNQANAYSALQELNHWNYDETDFVAEFAADAAIPTIRNRRPPYHYLYLVSDINEAGTRVSDDQQLAMVGQGLFFDLIGEEATAAGNSFRDDFDRLMIQPDRNGCPQYYMSFGLAMISYPKDRIQRACAYRLGAETIEAMCRATMGLVADALQIRVNQDLQAEKLDEGSLLNLLESIPEGTIQGQIENWPEQTLQHFFLEPDPPPVGSQIVQTLTAASEQYFSANLRNLALNVAPLSRKLDSTTMGTWVMQIHQHALEALGAQASRFTTGDQVGAPARALWQLAAQWVNDENLGFNGADQALGLVVGRYSGAAISLRKRAAVLRGTESQDDVPMRDRLPTITALEDRRSRVLRSLRSSLGNIPLGMIGRKGHAIMYYCRRYLNATGGMFGAVVQAYVAEYGAEVCEHLSQVAQDIRQRLSGYHQSLTDLANAMQNNCRTTLEAAPIIPGYALWDRDGFEALYAALTGPNLRPAARQAFLTGTGLAGPFELAERLAKGTAGAEQALLSACVPLYEGRVQGNVLTHLLGWKNPPPAQLINQAARMCVPYWRKSTYSAWSDTGNKRKMLIGVQRGASPRTEEQRGFQNLWHTHLQDQMAISVVPVADESYVLLRREQAAFPLAALEFLDRLQHAYEHKDVDTQSRTDIEWKAVALPGLGDQFKAWKTLAVAWCGSFIRYVDETGDAGGYARVGFRYPVSSGMKTLGPVELNVDEGRRRAAQTDKTGNQSARRREFYCYGILSQDQAIPIVMRPMVVDLAEDGSALKALEDLLARERSGRATGGRGQADAVQTFRERVTRGQEELLKVPAIAELVGDGLASALKAYWRDINIPEDQLLHGDSCGNCGGFIAKGADACPGCQKLLVCPNCGVRQIPTAKITVCHACDCDLMPPAKEVRRCPKCDAALPDSARRCIMCGHKLAEGE